MKDILHLMGTPIRCKISFMYFSLYSLGWLIIFTKEISFVLPYISNNCKFRSLNTKLIFTLVSQLLISGGRVYIIDFVSHTFWVSCIYRIRIVSYRQTVTTVKIHAYGVTNSLGIREMADV